MNLRDLTVLDNPLTDWALAVTTALALVTALILARRYLARRWAAHARTTASRIDDSLAEAAVDTHVLFFVVMGLYAGAQWLELPPWAERTVTSATVIAFLVQAALWANRGVAVWLSRYLPERQRTDAAGATTVTVLGFIARVVVWGLVVLLILDNLGFNITALVASLGIGGIAVALAVQNILGEQIVFSNTDLLKSRIRNYKRMAERRALFTFGLTYDTPTDKLVRVPEIVRACIKAQEKTRFDRAHFKEYGDSALVFEAVYYVLDPDYNRYMDVQQAINLALLEHFRAEGIGFAYPTRTLHVHGGQALDP